MPPYLKKIINFLLACAALWIFFGIVGPFFEARIPAWRQYNQIQREQDLDSGALYYSNVPQTQDAEENMRRAIKEAMAERRKQRESKQ